MHRACPERQIDIGPQQVEKMHTGCGVRDTGWTLRGQVQDAVGRSAGGQGAWFSKPAQEVETVLCSSAVED